MPRNLVICCDGTNNSLDSPLTNVAHLSALADIGDAARQLAYYDAGVGVEAHPNMRTRIGAMFSKWSGSAFGTGLVENVQNAYSHLVDNYSDGDHVYLFGFSRGAYTVRVIAGLLHNYGLLRRAMIVIVAAMPSIRSRKLRLYLCSTGRIAGEFSPWAANSALRLPNPMNIARKNMHSTIHAVGWTSTAYTPKSTRSTKPRAMHMTSAITACLRRSE